MCKGVIKKKKRLVTERDVELWCRHNRGLSFNHGGPWCWDGPSEISLTEAWFCHWIKAGRGEGWNFGVDNLLGPGAISKEVLAVNNGKEHSGPWRMSCLSEALLSQPHPLHVSTRGKGGRRVLGNQLLVSSSNVQNVNSDKYKAPKNSKPYLPPTSESDARLIMKDREHSSTLLSILDAASWPFLVTSLMGKSQKECDRRQVASKMASHLQIIRSATLHTSAYFFLNTYSSYKTSFSTASRILKTKHLK